MTARVHQRVQDLVLGALNEHRLAAKLRSVACSSAGCSWQGRWPSDFTMHRAEVVTSALEADAVLGVVELPPPTSVAYAGTWWRTPFLDVSVHGSRPTQVRMGDAVLLPAEAVHQALALLAAVDVLGRSE